MKHVHLKLLPYFTDALVLRIIASNDFKIKIERGTAFMLWNSNGVTHLTLIEDAANKYRYMLKRTMAISHTSSELCLTVSHGERGVSFFSRVQGERNIEILNFYLRSFIARYNSDPVKTCLSSWYIFYYATRKMKTSISPNKKK